MYEERLLCLSTSLGAILSCVLHLASSHACHVSLLAPNRPGPCLHCGGSHTTRACTQRQVEQGCNRCSESGHHTSVCQITVAARALRDAQRHAERSPDEVERDAARKSTASARRHAMRSPAKVKRNAARRLAAYARRRGEAAATAAAEQERQATT